MRITVELERLKAIENTMADIPKAPPIERWGMLFVCYNTVRQICAEAGTETAKADNAAKAEEG